MMVSARWQAAVVLGWLAGVVGCHDAGSGLDATPADAVVAVDDAAIDAAADVVTGQVIDRYRTFSGDVDLPVDLSHTAVQVFLRDATQAEGFREIRQFGTPAGTFAIAGVPPDATFYLKIGPTYYVTAVRHVVIRREHAHRPPGALVTMPTPITFDLTGLPPSWQPWSAALVTVNAGAIMGIGGNPALPPVHGDWFDAYQADAMTKAPLPASGTGDDLEVVVVMGEHLRHGPRTSRLIGTLDVGDPTLVDGQARTISGAVAVPPATIAPRVFADRAAIAATYDADATVGAAQIGVYVQASDALAWSPPGPMEFASLALALALQGDDDVVVDELATPAGRDPYPASWPRVEVTWYQRSRCFLIPRGWHACALGGTTRVVPVTPGVPSPPPVPPPTAVTVDGRDAMRGGAVSATRPVRVAWTGSPAAGQYGVSVWRAGAGSQLSGTVWTTATSVELPPALFQGGGGPFALTIAAFAGGNDYAAGDVEPRGVPGSLAVTGTVGFRASATCGDGVVDADEDCDGGGVETATCDLDCTFAVCGDGVRNVAAGEPCDAAVDAPGCDRDCTPVVCGDGHVNPDVEQCDDGNAVADGNGCSADCQLDNHCGDGVVEPLAEDCDDGQETSRCDADCTWATCGDGHQNPLAGETCDDGNTLTGDACDAACHLTP